MGAQEHYCVSIQPYLIKSFLRLTACPHRNRFVDNKPEATGDEFVALSKIDEDVSEKKVGFEGIPDPTTGYYCMYSSGKLMGEAGRSDAEMGITGGKKSGEKRTGL